MKKTITFIEILTGTLILALVFSGLLASFVSVRKYTRRANKRLVSVNLARDVLNRLYSEVREDNWDVAGTPLNATPAFHNLTEIGFSTNTPTVGIINYSGNYVVAPTAEDYRQVWANITYPDI
ncbi:MAG: hypothetical protein KKE55_06850 [Candidatus Omnitrophica bacterium]|nr:hypothetical protein [Candidatus Omnitrophota bacterium]MBU1524122.1 hypothetical protein [Candidatus Omnitrophota bacterium]MBU2437395.1 hypothetical protein [Candidatus Omnitrophota bacterium]